MGLLRTWRLALRIARRDALRAKGRSILVIAMIALPIIGVTAIDISFRSSQLTTEERTDRAMGAAAASLRLAGVPVHQDPENSQRYQLVDEDAVDEYYDSAADPLGEEAARGAAAITPSGAELIVEGHWYGAEVTTATGITEVEIREADLAHPVAGGKTTLLEGRAPRDANEVAASSAFLKTAGLSVGDTLSFAASDGGFTVTGSYELPSSLYTEQVTVLPDAGLIAEVAAEPDAEPERYSADYLVHSDAPFTWEMVLAANEQGWLVDSRAVRSDPPPRDQVPYDDGSWASPDDGMGVVMITVLALVILEICLLAGPAFAVGARRSRRMLGLMGANGADRRHVRAVMLSSGIVLGLAAAVVGIVLGLVAMLLAQEWLETSAGERFGALTIKPVELLAICVLGVGTGLLAALLPAITASRAPILESLTGRRGVRRVSRVLPVVGAVLFVLGAACALAGALTVNDSFLVAGGVIVAQLGLVATTPALVGVFGRVGGFLPLSGRLALRDAVRNRARTAPAVAAVLAAVSGAVAVATVVASTDLQQETTYDPTAPMGVVVIHSATAGSLPAAREAALRELPVSERAEVGRVVPGEQVCDLWQVSEACPELVVQLPEAAVCDWDTYYERLMAAREENPDLTIQSFEPACYSDFSPTPLWLPIAVAGPEYLDVLAADDPDAAAALERGEAVVYDELTIHGDGTVRFDLVASDHVDAEHEEALALPATLGSPSPYGGRPGEVLISAAAVEAAGYQVADHALVLATERQPADAEMQALRAALDVLPGDIYVYVEEGHTSDAEIVLLVLGLFAMVVTLGAAGIATGLAQADSEADLATLSAVGAPPRVRRTLSGLQCGVIALMGVILGALSGVVPGTAIVLSEFRTEHEHWQNSLDRTPETEPQLFLELPWETILQLVVVVPLVAAVVAALMTRSTPGVARRGE
ncbi:ABC transporter permease [Streptomyces lonarensis]|uniref:ABC transporter permease n=1 Tax=Streptomyces lonarensis TaxID=700599 RepID=A0A7X6D1B5_9ACTN|nr:ABC transporter permease [Streptomyces lonarensis]NJQ06327.1 ABC transporter permease [Streptomyces lonarensis]